MSFDSGLETKRPNLLLGLAIIQRTKRSGSFPQEPEEKRPKVHLAKDPMWIPKPPVLYGSDKLDVFQPYDPETPANPALPSSPPCPGSPSDSSSSLSEPSLFRSARPNPTAALPPTAPATQPTSASVSDKSPGTTSGSKAPLHNILKGLFGGKPTESTASSDLGPSNASCVKKPPALSQVAGTMLDPIVQQYGQKSKIKEIEEENDFDRPYDPEEEYDPAAGYGTTALKSIENNQEEGRAASSCVDDDVAYDPEDETLFADVSCVAAKPPVPNQISNFPSCDTPFSTQAAAPAPTPTAPSDATPKLPSGTVVVSAATLSEQQRMLEELNKQIEEQKRQLKEQEEALRQQREAVGMFMAQFSVSDPMASAPAKPLPLSQLSSLKVETEAKSSEGTDKTADISSNAENETTKPQDTAVPKDETDDTVGQDEANTDAKEGDKYSSAGEIEDSDVAYDPEDESFFKEVEEGHIEGNSRKTYDRSLSRRSRSTSHRGSQNSSHSRKRRLSPKRRSHRERDHHRSPSRKSQRRSSSHSQKRRERDRHRRSDRDRARHRGRDHSERHGRHRKEHSTHRQSRGRRSPSSLTQQELSPELDASSTIIPIKSESVEQMINCNDGENLDESSSSFSHELLHKLKVETSEQRYSDDIVNNSFSNHNDPSQGTPTLGNTPTNEQNQLDSKIESMIPLREIDPPLRDSPESPDPEPQFVKPRSVETRDAVNAEKMLNASVKLSGPISSVPVIPSTSSSHSVLDLQNQNNQAVVEPRNTEQLGKGFERGSTLKSETPFMQVRSTEVKGLLGLKMEVDLPDPEKPNNSLGVNFQQCKNVAEPNMSVCSTTVPEDQIFTANGRRIEQTGKEERPSIPNITNPDWRGHDLAAPGMRNQRCQNTGFGPHGIDPHCSVEGSDMQNQWRGPNMRGPCAVRGRGGPFVQDERKYQSKWGGPNIDNPRHSRSSPTSQDFMTSGPDIEGPVHDRRDPGNPHSRRIDPERGGPNNDSQERGIRGPRGEVFERRTTLVDGLGPEIRGYPIDHQDTEKRGGPDFRGPEQYMNHPLFAKRGLGCPEFKGPGLDRRHLGEVMEPDRRGPDKRVPFMSNLRPDGMGPGGPDFQKSEPDWRGVPMETSGHMRTGLTGPTGALKPGRIGPAGPESISDSNIDGPGPERRTAGDKNLSGPEPDFPGAWTKGPGPDFMGVQPEKPGPRHHTRRQGREPFRGSNQESEFQNMEGPHSAQFRGLGLERRPAVMARPHNRGFPDTPEFSVSVPERISPAMDECESERRSSHFRGIKPVGPGLEGPTNISRGFRGVDPNRQPCDAIGTDIRGPEPNRNEQGVPGFREFGDEFRPGTRQNDLVTDRHRSRRDQWHETGFVGSEPIQGGPDMDGPSSRDTSHTFRGSRRTNFRGPRSESERWKEPNFRASSLERRGMDLQEEWPKGRGLGIEAIENERHFSESDWRLHQDRSPRFTHEGLDEQFQHRQGPVDWRGPDNRGPKMLQERPSIYGRGPRGEFSGSDFRSPGLVRDHPAMVHPGSTGEDSRNDFMSQDGDEPNRWGSGVPFRGPRDSDNRRKRPPIMRGPGPDMRVSPDVENDFGHPDFRDTMRGSNMEGHRTFSRGQGFETPTITRRTEMEDLERRLPRGIESECPGLDGRNFPFDGPDASRRFSDCGRMRSQRPGDNLENPRSIREGSEESRRGNRNPNMRRPGPDETDLRDLAPETSGVRHGPGRWDALTEGSRSESMRGKPALTRFNSPSEASRLHGPSGPLRPGYERPQGPQPAQPQGRKTALLPTPTGPMCFPNHAVKNPGSFGPEGKHVVHSTPVGSARGRSVSRDR